MPSTVNQMWSGSETCEISTKTRLKSSCHCKVIPKSVNM